MRRGRTLSALATMVVVMVIGMAAIMPCVAAESLTVEKIVEQTDIQVGDDVTIMLRFTNPFGTEIPIQLVDKNVFGNNGLDVQCLERTLPDQRETTLAYEPITPYAPGSYTLEPATVTYTSPETGKEETVTSNALDITVNGTAAQVQVQGVTTIYECGGQSIHSTSYSSGSSMSVQVGGSTGTGGMGQQNQQEGDPGDLVQNNQLNQNTGAIKEEMQREMQKQQQMGDELKKQIAENREFQKKHQELLNDGYNLTNASANPTSNNTGDFELEYQKPGGETARLAGSMENGSMQELMSQTSEDTSAIMDALEQNPEFQRLDYGLNESGFDRGAAAFDQISQNHTQVTVPYVGKDGEKREICADYTNGTIENVAIAGEPGRDRDLLGLLILALTICAACVAGWSVYRKYMNKAAAPPAQPMEKPENINIDYVTVSRGMISEARGLFERGEEKEAYAKVSEALRFYFSHKFGVNRELTGIETVRLLEKENQDVQKVGTCLNRCELVEFAKSEPDAAEFWNMAGVADELIE
ncbi:MAG: hypothetical protein U9N46_01965 [Euryarchaeota archaeon]|nr:MAG: hypothetical protein C5S47_07145 [ANME-2 cluster archaeon]MEA1863959.1 hypothetical protein [Euryarchaeota archaeon]